MGYIVLELVRDKDGRVTNVVPINIPVRRVESGYVQIVKGEIMNHFDEDEIVVAEIHDTSL